MDIDKNIPFPQADDFEKVVALTNIEDESMLADKTYVSELLGGISERQVAYYTNAAKYLGIIDNNKTFTEVGKRIRNLNQYLQRVEFIRLLMSDKVVGRAFISEKLMDIELEFDDIKALIYEEYPNYSEDIYIRRGRTVVKWIEWINNQFNN